MQVVDLGEMGPVRCSRCKAYMNAFVRFSSSGRNYTCNFCNHNNIVPDAYFCHMGHDGRRCAGPCRVCLTGWPVHMHATPAAAAQ